MGLSKPAVTTQENKISPHLAGPSKTMIDALMGYAANNPWDMENTGPRMAAMNAAQTGVMDQTAAAGNAFGMPMQSAAAGLPQAVDMGGTQAYDILGQAKAGISPQMQQLYDQLYGDEGLMAKYRLNAGAGAAAPAAPAQPAPGYDRYNLWGPNDYSIGGGR